MSTGIYVAYTGATSELQQLEVIANNVANASTVGFRRDLSQFDTVLAARMPFVRASAGGIDLTPAAHRFTGDRLHAALSDDSFFVVEGPDGGEYYTRRGDFRIGPNGELSLPGGHSAVGSSGALIVPPGSDPHLEADGTLSTADGPVGRVRIVRFEDTSALRKLGQNLIVANEGADPQDVPGARVSVGFVEGSNVNLAAEMVALIQTKRSFEATMRSIQIADQLTDRLVEVTADCGG
jgi:flagellar basal-body rod protein FlgF